MAGREGASAAKKWQNVHYPMGQLSGCKGKATSREKGPGTGFPKTHFKSHEMLHFRYIRAETQKSKPDQLMEGSHWPPAPQSTKYPKYCLTAIQCLRWPLLSSLIRAHWSRHASRTCRVAPKPLTAQSSVGQLVCDWFMKGHTGPPTPHSACFFLKWLQWAHPWLKSIRKLSPRELRERTRKKKQHHHIPTPHCQTLPICLGKSYALSTCLTPILNVISSKKHL